MKRKLVKIPVSHEMLADILKGCGHKLIVDNCISWVSSALPMDLRIISSECSVSRGLTVFTCFSESFKELEPEQEIPVVLPVFVKHHHTAEEAIQSMFSETNKLPVDHDDSAFKVTGEELAEYDGDLDDIRSTNIPRPKIG